MGYIINISLHSQIIGSYFWWYLCSILSLQQTKYSLSATDRVTNPPTLQRIIRKSLFFPTVHARNISSILSEIKSCLKKGKKNKEVSRAFLKFNFHPQNELFCLISSIQMRTSSGNKKLGPTSFNLHPLRDFFGRPKFCVHLVQF